MLMYTQPWPSRVSGCVYSAGVQIDSPHDSRILMYTERYYQGYVYAPIRHAGLPDNTIPLTRASIP